MFAFGIERRSSVCHQQCRTFFPFKTSLGRIFKTGITDLGYNYEIERGHAYKGK